MKRTPQTAGFSLLEVMVAILILGIALVGLTEGVTNALTSTKESELQTTAAMIAAGIIEGIRTDGDLVDGTKEGDCGEDLALYKYTQTIAATPINGLHEVTIDVQHTKTGKSIYELKTMLFDPPPETAEERAALKKQQGKPKSRKGRS